MPARTSKKFEILRRRRQIAELYVQRHTQATIADKLGISQATVSADIKRIRREWRASTLRDFDSACELELQKTAAIGNLVSRYGMPLRLGLGLA